MPLSREFDYLPAGRGSVSAAIRQPCADPVRQPPGKQAWSWPMRQGERSCPSAKIRRSCRNARRPTAVLADRRPVAHSLYDPITTTTPLVRWLLTALPAMLRQGKPLHPTLDLSLPHYRCRRPPQISTYSGKTCTANRQSCFELLIDVGGNGHRHRYPDRAVTNLAPRGKGRYSKKASCSQLRGAS